MSLVVDIDENSGFCAGVIKAISKAEAFLNEHPEERLYSLGAIVHNEEELGRLESRGLVTIDREDLDDIEDAGGKTLLIRAHGEPLATYALASGIGFNIIDCTCSTVLALQKNIKEAYVRQQAAGRGGQIIIFGKIGHAEVLGLQGQIDGDCLVIENQAMLQTAITDGKIDLHKPVEIFSQTTKSPAEYSSVCARLEEMMARENELEVKRFRGRGLLTVHNSVCPQVAGRFSRLSKFAFEHDIIIFVSDRASSNGKVLCDLCKSMNIRTYHISRVEEIKKEWFRTDDRAGVCGATSTPKWLLEKVAEEIRTITSN